MQNINTFKAFLIDISEKNMINIHYTYLNNTTRKAQTDSCIRKKKEK